MGDNACSCSHVNVNLRGICMDCGIELILEGVAYEREIRSSFRGCHLEFLRSFYGSLGPDEIATVEEIYFTIRTVVGERTRPEHVAMFSLYQMRLKMGTPLAPEMLAIHVMGGDVSPDDALKQLRKAFKIFSPTLTTFVPILLKCEPEMYLEQYVLAVGACAYESLTLSMLRFLKSKIRDTNERPHKVCASILYWVLQRSPVPARVYRCGYLDSSLFSRIVCLKEAKVKSLASFFGHHLKEPYGIALRYALYFHLPGPSLHQVFPKC